jgi:hypothetical protein
MNSISSSPVSHFEAHKSLTIENIHQREQERGKVHVSVDVADKEETTSTSGHFAHLFYLS